MTRILLLLILALALVPACAQIMPGQPDGDDEPVPDFRFEAQMALLRTGDGLPPVMQATPDGLFVVQKGVLAKYDPQTGKLSGTLALFGPPPTWSDKVRPMSDASTALVLERVRRMYVPGVATAGSDLLLVIGSQFFRVDGKALKVKIASTIYTPDPVLDFARAIVAPEPRALMSLGPMGLLAAPQVEVSGRVLQVIRAKTQIVAVNIEDGAVLARQSLPDEMLKSLVPRPQQFAPDNPAQPPVDGRTFVVIGKLVQDADTGVPMVRDDTGAEYELGGIAKQLARTPETEALRLLFVGTYRKAVNGNPALGKGALEVGAYLDLTVLVAK